MTMDVGEDRRRMAKAAPQYTAAQILDAARRAEADGRLEYAVQFFRHLSDFHGRTPEAAAARQALKRIASHYNLETMNGAAGASNGQPQGRALRSANDQPTPEPVGKATPLAQSGAAQPPAAPNAIGRGPIHLKPVAHDYVELDDRQLLVVPERRDAYWLSRGIAVVIGCLAWLAFAYGLTLMMGATLGIAGEAWFGRLLDLVPVPWIGPVALISGLSTVVICRHVRAMFDTANLLRELVEIERARVTQTRLTAR